MLYSMPILFIFSCKSTRVILPKQRGRRIPVLSVVCPGYQPQATIDGGWDSEIYSMHVLIPVQVRLIPRTICWDSNLNAIYDMNS
mmetsp:Transcript_23559/g.49278  ORF Transcript_23559/g.49278 Transcript_23559/m.49278 type:complete len:85 (-) Transcript_23559:461-715(-)